MRIALRPMELGDIPQVSEIDKEAFPTQWPTTSYRRELQRNKIARYLIAYDADSKAPSEPAEPAAVAPGSLGRLLQGIKRLFSQGDAARPTPHVILGFVALWFMHDEAHVTAIAVREAYRQRGIGELLLLSSIDLALENDMDVVTLEVRVSNYPAQSLYLKYGFQNVGVRKGYYSDNHEDAYIMTTEKITLPSFQNRLQRLRQQCATRWNLRLSPGYRGAD